MKSSFESICPGALLHEPRAVLEAVLAAEVPELVLPAARKRAHTTEEEEKKRSQISARDQMGTVKKTRRIITESTETSDTRCTI